MGGLSESPRLASPRHDSPPVLLQHSYRTQAGLLRRNQSFGARNWIAAAPLVGSHGSRNALLHGGFAVCVGSAEDQQYRLGPACFDNHDGAALLRLAHRYHKLLHFGIWVALEYPCMGCLGLWVPSRWDNGRAIKYDWIRVALRILPCNGR